MTANPGPPAVLEIRRVLPGTPEEVFQAWTDPDLIHHWMSPVGHAEAEIDLRVGGTFTIVMIGEGRRIEHTGEYVEVDRPRTLAFTWRSQFTGDLPTVVRIELSPHGDQTELALRHEELSEDAAASHGDGWGRMLDRLAPRLGAPA